jgi:hypothetical protein
VRAHAALFLAAFLFLGANPPVSPPGVELPPEKVRDLFSVDQRMRGVCWVAGRRVDETVFRPLVQGNVEWISQTPFGWMRSADSTDIQIATAGEIYWGETDEGLAQTTRLARGFGIRTLLKPHLWVAGWHDTVWTGEIKMKSDDLWKAWFASYQKFILHYAALAEKNGMCARSITAS